MVERMFDTGESPTPDASDRPVSTVADFDALITAQNFYLYELLSRIPAFDTERIWFESGAVSMTNWLTARYKVSHTTAAEWVRAAYAFTELPHIRRAFLDGALSWDQLRAVTRVATAETDAEWAKRAPKMRSVDIKPSKQPVPADQVARAHEQRSVEWWFRDDEPIMDMHIVLPDSDGATLATALMRRANQFGPDPITGRFESFEARCADALIQLASQTLASDADHDRATVLIRADLATLRCDYGVATIDDGPDLSRDTLRRLTCDAQLQMAITDPGGQIIGVGRTMRTPPAWLRRLVLARDGGCQFPGCHRRHWLIVHHLVHWADGGPTDLDNLITLCGFHHRLIHHHGWTISGDPNHHIDWINQFGQIFEPVPPATGLENWRNILALIPDIAPPPDLTTSTPSSIPWDTS
jgi:hypothetical protein